MEYEMGVIAPWRRFFARIVDLSFFSIVYGSIAGVVIGLLQPQLLETMLFTNPLVLTMVNAYFASILSGLFVGGVGTSPGKYLFGLKLRTINGELLGLTNGVRRDMRVYVQGLAFGIPIVLYMTAFWSKGILEKEGVTPWDKGQYTMSVMKDSLKRKILTIIGIISFVILLFINAFLQVLGRTL